MSSPRLTTRTALLSTAVFAVLAVPAIGQASHEDLKLLADDGTAGDEFGHSVAMHSGVVAVGAPSDDDAGADSGSAYLLSATTGAQLAKLLPGDGLPGDEFGFSIAIDGGTVAVGAWADDDNGDRSGSAYLFDAATGAEFAKLLPRDGQAGDEFGFAIAIHNGIVVVGAKRDDDNGLDSGSAYLFDATTGMQLAKLLAGDGAANDNFGEAVDIADGIVAVGAHGDDDNGFLSGSAYLFDASSGAQLAKLLPTDGATNDFFGASIQIDNGVVVVGASYKSHAGKHSGVAYLFDVATESQIAKLVPLDGAPYDRFGNSVAIGDGNVVVGSFRDNDNGFSSGSAYLFDVAGGLVTKLLASDGAAGDKFGWSVASGGGSLTVGAVGDDDRGTDAGSAYVFDLLPDCQPNLGFQGPGSATASMCGTGLNVGESSDYEISGAPGSAAGALFISIDGFANVPVLGGTLVSFGGFAIQGPLVASGTGTVSITFVGLPHVLDLVFQSVFLDPSLPQRFAFTNAIRAQYGQ